LAGILVLGSNEKLEHRKAAKIEFAVALFGGMASFVCFFLAVGYVLSMAVELALR
jgi:hypothetical protein